MLVKLKADILSCAHRGTPRYIRSVLWEDATFMDELLAMDPFPTPYRAPVFAALRFPPWVSDADRAAADVAWAERVVKASWLVPARFEKILANIGTAHPDAVVVLTRHRNFRLRHVFKTLATYDNANHSLSAAFRAHSPELHALTDVYEGLYAHDSVFGQHFRALSRERSPRWMRAYADPLELMALEEVRAVAGVLTLPPDESLELWSLVLETARLTCLSAKKGRRIRLPKAVPAH
jgi:hypothetical protein